MLAEKELSRPDADLFPCGADLSLPDTDLSGGRREEGDVGGRKEGRWRMEEEGSMEEGGGRYEGGCRREEGGERRDEEIRRMKEV